MGSGSENQTWGLDGTLDSREASAAGGAASAKLGGCGLIFGVRKSELRTPSSLETPAKNHC